MRVAAEQRVIGPGDPVYALPAHHLPLGPLDRKTDPLAAPGGVNPEDVRMVLEQWSVLGLDHSGKAECKPHQVVPDEGANTQPAVVDYRHQHVGRNHIGLGIQPYQPLQCLRCGHIFRSLEETDDPLSHGG